MALFISQNNYLFFIVKSINPHYVDFTQTQTQGIAMNIWKKHEGAWCIAVEGIATTGQTVTVTKRDGTTSQVILGERVMANIFKVAPPAPAARERAVVGEMAGLLQLFDRAAQHLRNPAVVLGIPGTETTLRITRAGQTAAVPGSLNVLDNTQYSSRTGRRRWYGRVTRAGVFDMAPGANPAITERLQALAADPVRVAAEHGRLTGNCCFCNRALEDARSTAVGYGPVCAGHYALPWGDRAPVAQPQRQQAEDDVEAFERLSR